MELQIVCDCDNQGITSSCVCYVFIQNKLVLGDIRPKKWGNGMEKNLFVLKSERLTHKNKRKIPITRKIMLKVVAQVAWIDSWQLVFRLPISNNTLANK